MDRQKEREDRNVTVFIYFVMTVILGLMVLRSQCEIEITDEAYYIAEAYSFLDGNVPFAYNTVLTSGFAMVLSPIIAIWKLICPTMEGVFLYTRMLFLCFRMICIIIVFRCLKNHYQKNRLLLSLLVLFPYWGMSIPNFSYNTIASWILLLVGGMMFYSYMSNDFKLQNTMSVLCGCLVAVAVIAHPAQAINAIWFAVLWLNIGKRRKNLKVLWYYALSGITTTVIVFVYIVLCSGLKELAFGIETIINYGTFIKPVPFIDAIKGLLITFGIEMLLIIAPYIIGVVLGFQMKEKGEKTNGLPLYATLIGTLMAFLYIIFCKTGAEIFWHLGFVGGLDSVLIAVLPSASKNRWLMHCFIMPYYFFITINGFMTYCDVSKRMYIFIPTFMVLGLIMYETDSVRKGGSILVTTILCIAVFLTTKTDMQYIYKGYPIERLDVKIESGVYRGIYTVKDKANSIVELESYIKENTNDDMNVLFMEVVPMAYLMSNGHAFCPTTWDIMQYSYGNNDSEGMLRYFESRGDIPDKIIYVDTGRDEMLSIDKNGYEFNKFVEKNYNCVERRQIGNRFKTVLYKNKEIYRR